MAGLAQIFPAWFHEWPADDRVTYVAGYLNGVWQYGVHRNGTVEIGTMGTPYRDVFKQVIDFANIAMNDALRVDLNNLGVVIPSFYS